MLAAILLAISGGRAGAAEPAPVRIVVGSPTCLCYLPVLLAKELGLFHKNGVDVALDWRNGGSRALAVLFAGKADIVAGYYEHTIEQAAKGRHLRAFVLFGRLPGFVLVASPRHEAEIRSPRDLVGRTVGVSAPGSASDFFLKYYLGRNDIDPARVPVRAVGNDRTALAALEQGQVAAAVLTDPAATLLFHDFRKVHVFVDARTESDTHWLYGGDYPSGSLFAPDAWIEAHSAETQALADGIVEALQWIHTHSVDEIVAAVPPDVIGAHRERYRSAVENSLPLYAINGRIDPRDADAVLAAVAQVTSRVAADKIDVTATYTNAFSERAAVKFGVPLP